MPNPVTRRFIEALEALERARDLSPMQAVFDSTAELSNLASSHGTEDVSRFWSRYRDRFDEVTSAFSRIIEAGDDVVLVWRTRGRLRSGHPIEYNGVSIVSVVGDRISKFETVYDSAAFVQPVVAAREST